MPRSKIVPFSSIWKQKMLRIKSCSLYRVEHLREPKKKKKINGQDTKDEEKKALRSGLKEDKRNTW